MKLFFAKLKPFVDIKDSQEYAKLRDIDYDTGQQLIRQMIAFLTFYAANENRWILVEREISCGYLYAKEAEDIVLFDQSFFIETSGMVVIGNQGGRR